MEIEELDPDELLDAKGSWSSSGAERTVVAKAHVPAEAIPSAITRPVPAPAPAPAAGRPAHPSDDDGPTLAVASPTTEAFARRGHGRPDQRRRHAHHGEPGRRARRPRRRVSTAQPRAEDSAKAVRSDSTVRRPGAAPAAPAPPAPPAAVPPRRPARHGRPRGARRRHDVRRRAGGAARSRSRSRVRIACSSSSRWSSSRWSS